MGARMTNQAFIKDLNERRLLSLLRVERLMTRTEIARRLRLTKSTVTTIVDGMLGQELVAEVQEVDASRVPRRVLGRPGVDISLCPSGGYFVGAEIAAGEVRMVLLDMTLQVWRDDAAALAGGSSPEQAVRHISSFLARCRADLPTPGRIRSICVAVPGVVRHDGFIARVPSLDWENVPFLSLAREKLGLPVLVTNDADAAAFGEVYCHPNDSGELTVYLKLGAACGGAAVIDGRLLRGFNSTATEFGHLRVASGSRRCSCGAQGCLEPIVNTDALAHYATRARFKDGGEPSTLLAAAKRGNPRAGAALAEYSRALGLGLVSLTNMFNPSLLVIGGDLQPVVAACLSEVREIIHAGIVPGMNAPHVRVSRNGAFESAIGAAALAHQHAFDETSLGFA